MDEPELKAICGHNSCYFSLQDQDEATTILKSRFLPQRPDPSFQQQANKDHPTYFHLVVHSKPHWTACQVSISPFSLLYAPKQRFHLSEVRYTLCCQQAAEAGLSIDLICTRIQNLYDLHYQPNSWDFSSRHWYLYYI